MALASFPEAPRVVIRKKDTYFSKNLKRATLMLLIALPIWLIVFLGFLDEGKKEAVIVVILAGVGYCLVLGMWMLIFWGQSRRELRLLTSGTVVQGYVNHVTKTRGGYKAHVTCEFGGKKRWPEPDQFFEVNQVRKGDEVSIFFDPRTPSEVVIYEVAGYLIEGVGNAET